MSEITELDKKIVRFETRLTDPEISPDQRLVFSEALKNARKRRDDLIAQSSTPVTPPPSSIALEQPPRATIPPPVSRTKPPIAQEPYEPRTAERLTEYLAGRGVGSAPTGTDEFQQERSVKAAQKKTAVGTDRGGDKKSFSGASQLGPEKVIVIPVELPEQLVPSYRFEWSDGTVSILQPGQIRQYFRARMNDLERMQKQLHYSRMLPKAIAYYQALCLYDGRVLSLEDFRFSSARKREIFEIIRAQAPEIQREEISWAKPRFSRKMTSAAASNTKQSLRQRARGRL